MMSEVFFEVSTPLAFTVRCSQARWEFIVSQKRPILAGHEGAVKEVLETPEQVRRSRKDPNVFPFYKGSAPRWLCAVARRDDGSGFLITAYPTDAVKAGEIVWTRSR